MKPIAVRRSSHRKFPSAQNMGAHAKAAAGLMKALAHPVRLLVLCHLIDNELAVGALLARLSLSASSLSQHLAVLREEGVVRTRREAQTIYYSIADGPVLEVMQALYKSYCAVRKV
jgi:DNA-binding transcriptional ArsR family regulator